MLAVKKIQLFLRQPVYECLVKSIYNIVHLYLQDIVHLDLKPENVLLVSPESSRVKIIDFGLAKKFSDSQQVVRVLRGTPEFVPPEVVNYEPIGFSSDMWSIGIIAYVILSGLSPFLGNKIQ